eukprot:s2155_g9.t1
MERSQAFDGSPSHAMGIAETGSFDILAAVCDEFPHAADEIGETTSTDHRLSAGNSDATFDLATAFCDEEVEFVGREEEFEMQQLQRVEPEHVQSVQCLASTDSQNSSSTWSSYSLKGKVGRGRHGDRMERQLICSHMRAEKRAKRNHENAEALVKALQHSSLKKNGATFNLVAKHRRKGGVEVVLHKASTKGNRYVRKIHFMKFLQAAYGMSSANVAIAASLDVDASTLPRLQKTCAGIYMNVQSKLLARLYNYCRQFPPTVVHYHVKWDETTVATSLNPGGTTQSVKSAWSVLVVRIRLLVSWPSGGQWQMRVVMPTIPLMSSSADQIYYGLRYHPSFYALNQILKLIGTTAQIRCNLHEVDGAYSNVRLHHHLLSQPRFDPSKPGGEFLDTVRCQSHATHLISVSMLALIGGNLMSRLYGLAVFLRNLGYLLRLQLALKKWLDDAQLLFLLFWGEGRRDRRDIM